MGGHVQSVRGGELAQPTTEQPTPRCPAPYLPCRTSDHQEAGGVLERVESRRQGAVGTEPVLQEKKCWKGPPRKGVRFGKSVAEVVSKRPEGPKRQMKITPKTGLCQGPREGGKRAKGEEPTGWTTPDGHLPSRRLVLSLSRVTFSADFLGWREQSLSGERDPGPQQWTAIKKPHQPGTRRLCPAQMSPSIPQDPKETGMGVRDSYSKANVREWRFLSRLHLNSPGNFVQGTYPLWASVFSYI